MIGIISFFDWVAMPLIPSVFWLKNYKNCQTFDVIICFKCTHSPLIRLVTFWLGLLPSLFFDFTF